jgi:hypothetical protein
MSAMPAGVVEAAMSTMLTQNFYALKAWLNRYGLLD